MSLQQLTEKGRCLVCRQSLATWFSVGLLQLQPISWDTSSASLLEKVMLYEAVHPIQGWPDLHQRLGPMRRCKCSWFQSCTLRCTSCLYIPAVYDWLMQHESSSQSLKSSITCNFMVLAWCNRGLTQFKTGILHHNQSCFACHKTQVVQLAFKYSLASLTSIVHLMVQYLNAELSTQSSCLHAPKHATRAAGYPALCPSAWSSCQHK